MDTSTQEHIVFVPQSLTANRNTDLNFLKPPGSVRDSSTKPAAPYAEALPLSLPPMMITLPVTSLGSWQAWDIERDGKEPSLDGESNLSVYLKGNYAAADQRSGLNWRKVITVSCW